MHERYRNAGSGALWMQWMNQRERERERESSDPLLAPLAPPLELSRRTVALVDDCSREVQHRGIEEVHREEGTACRKDRRAPWSIANGGLERSLNLGGRSAMLGFRGTMIGLLKKLRWGELLKSRVHGFVGIIWSDGRVDYENCPRVRIKWLKDINDLLSIIQFKHILFAMLARWDH